MHKKSSATVDPQQSLYYEYCTIVKGQMSVFEITASAINIKELNFSQISS